MKCLLGLDTYQGMMLNGVISGVDVDYLTEITLPEDERELDAIALKRGLASFGNTVEKARDEALSLE